MPGKTRAHEGLGPVTSPSHLEQLLFDAGLVVQVPLATIYDIKARTSIQRSWQYPEGYVPRLDVQNPAHWSHKLHACVRGEFFAHALGGCRRVLDAGCGEGWPSLYLARSIPHVVGLDLSPEHIALARNTAKLMGLASVRFEVGHIEALPFPDQSYDGVCFGGNVFTYQSDPRVMLRELCRVLASGGPFAFEQWPVDPATPPWEKILWFIDAGAPILHYGAGSGLFSRAYLIHLRPDSGPGKRLAQMATRMSGELSAEQQRACEEIMQQIEHGALDVVEKALCSGEDRSLAAEEFPSLLRDAGFAEVTSWALPDALTFARALQQDGVLARLRAEDLLPCLRALVASAAKCPGWANHWVTCRKSWSRP